MAGTQKNKFSSLNFVDRAVNFFAPGLGLKRMQNRYRIAQAQLLTRKFEAAATGRRTGSWIANSTSANAEIHQALASLRNRSRDLVRNNPYAKNAVRKIANNVVGTGIIPTPVLNSRPQEKKIKNLWKDWAESTQCDFDGHYDFAGIEKLVMRTVAESGECLVRKRIVNDPSLPLPLQLQVLEGDFIDTFKHGPLADGAYIMYGVEFNKLGKIIAYWLYENHPGDSGVINFNTVSNRYPADEIIHVFEKERPGQFRGVPAGHGSMLRLKDLDEYEDAQLVRQKIAACFSVFVTDSNVAMPGMSADDSTLTDMVEPGIIQKLKPGESVAFATPPGAEGFGEYTKTVLRGIAAGYGMDYTTLTGDLTSVNFSSGRMGWLEFNRNIAEWQWQMLVPMFCNKAWGWFIQMAAIYGVTRAGVAVRVSWSTPKREQINPEAETKATLASVQGGLIAWSDAILEAGYNPDEQIDKMKRDKEAFEKAGLPAYTDKAKMADKVPPAAADNQQQNNNNADGNTK